VQVAEKRFVIYSLRKLTFLVKGEEGGGEALTQRFYRRWGRGLRRSRTDRRKGAGTKTGT